MIHTLWRLEGASDTTLVQPLRFEQGLRLHLQHTELTTVLMQIGAQQQAYVRMNGCEGCAHGRCLPGCYVELLRRLVQICFDSCALRPVASGLAKRLYRRVVLAWPTTKAAPVADLSLSPWPEARQSVHWRSSNQQIAGAALLAVGADGPDPAHALRSAGWQAWTLPKSLGPKLANSAVPTALPFPRAWPHAPSLLWPRSGAIPCPEQHDTQSAHALSNTSSALVSALSEGETLS
jgi:hypothetical protein